jgi:predicted RNA-binding protein with PUA-like domain
LQERFGRPITLNELKHYANRGLKNFRLLMRGNRLSVMPVTERQWKFIMSLR